VLFRFQSQFRWCLFHFLSARHVMCNSSLSKGHLIYQKSLKIYKSSPFNGWWDIWTKDEERWRKKT
jgi:hypothetical protein